MHQEVTRALEEIDAAVFSGDTFSTDRGDLTEFKYYLDRWTRALPDLEDELAAFEEDQDDVEDNQSNQRHDGVAG